MAMLYMCVGGEVIPTLSVYSPLGLSSTKHSQIQWSQSSTVGMNAVRPAGQLVYRCVCVVCVLHGTNVREI